MNPFLLHPQLAADSRVVAETDLCLLLMMNDARYPWFVLVPKRIDVQEIYQLAPDEQRQLFDESIVLGRALMQAYEGDKLNLAALGNLVPQLHLHHVVRYKTDDAWPAPVWGRHPAKAYDVLDRQQRLDQLVPLLDAHWHWR